MAMRLTDHLADNRRLYSRPAPTMPDIMLIDLPACFAGETLPLGRYYPIILETAGEVAELEAFLAAERTDAVLPDLFDRRPSAIASECVVVARYRPPHWGWPWVMLCQWPATYTAMVPSDGDYFARGAYTIEVFWTCEELISSESQLRTTLADHQFLQIENLLPGIGHA